MDKKRDNKASKILDSTLFNIIIVLAVLYSVFAWDITRGWLPKTYDFTNEIIMAVCFILFSLELILYILGRKGWYFSPVFWIYFIATVTMIFDIPSLMFYMTGTRMLVVTAKNLRLIKILRILSRLGRLLRIIKNFALGWIKKVVDKIFNKNYDRASVIQIKRIREKISDAVYSPAWTKLEITLTTSILLAFFLIFLPVTLYIDRESNGTEIVKAFSYLNSEDIEAFKRAYPNVYYLTLDNKTLIDDREREKDLREQEIRAYGIEKGSIKIDISDSIKSKARLMTWINLLMVLFSSMLTIFIDWVISRYSLEISGTLKTLAHALDERDSYTRMHSRHVSDYAVNTARFMGMNKKGLDIIKLAGELHDIGKIGVPEAILHKPGRLEEAEYAIMKKHTEQGARILDPLMNLDQVILAVYHHHEKYDGTGYPDGLKGKDIPLIARILSVCDVWDALTTNRPYRNAMPFDKAKNIIIMGSGTDFCPDVVKAFFDAGAWDIKEVFPET